MINEETYLRKVQSMLAGVTGASIAKALGVSRAYAGRVRRGEHRPHPHGIGWRSRNSLAFRQMGKADQWFTRRHNLEAVKRRENAGPDFSVTLSIQRQRKSGRA